MERLYASWRYDYVESPRKKYDNLFEELPKEGKGEENYILHRTKSCYLMLNSFPYNAGHLLAIPYRPVERLHQLTTEERTGLTELVIFAEELLTKALQPEGFNIGMNLGRVAGAGIPNHLHVHIVPRWGGDSNFMPVIGETRVLPIALKEMWKRLKKFV